MVVIEPGHRAACQFESGGDQVQVLRGDPCIDVEGAIVTFGVLDECLVQAPGENDEHRCTRCELRLYEAGSERLDTGSGTCSVEHVCAWLENTGTDRNVTDPAKDDKMHVERIQSTRGGVQP